jgi:hypothetical protein
LTLKELADLRESLKKQTFDYKLWMEIADLHEKHGALTHARELRKEAARLYNSFQK